MADENENVVTQDEAEYYYDMTPTAEEIDNVLVDLTAVLKDVGEFDVVKRVKAINGERAKLILGEGGGKTVIPGDLNVLVAADGEGNAKVNPALFSAELGQPEGIAKLQTPMPSIEIGSTVNVLEKYWGNNKNNAKFFMSGSPLLQMLKRQGSSPVISMLGAGVFEMYAYQLHNNQIDYTRSLPKYSSSGEKCLSVVAYHAYQGKSPYGDNNPYLNSSEIFPYFHMSNSSTVIMEGASIIKMADSAGFEMAGNADVVIRGGALTDYRGKQVNSGKIRTGLYMEPGSTIRMTRTDSTDGGDYGPMIAIESSNSKSGPGKLLITAQRGIYNGIYDYNEHDHDLDISLKSRAIYFYNKLYNHRKFIYNRTIDTSCFHSALDAKLFQPTLNVMGKTYLSIGDSGYFAAKIAPNTGGYTAIDWSGYGHEDIKIGTSAGAIVLFNMCHGAGAVASYNIEPAQSSDTIFNYCPSGISSINYSPQGTCAISFTPNSMTEITYQWDALDALIEGDNAYIQTSGNFHTELHGGSFIMRTTTPANDNVIYGGHPRNSHLGRDWTIFVQNTTDPVFQMYDKSNFAMAADIEREYTGDYKFTNGTTMSREDFEASTKYQTFLNDLATHNRTLISYTIENESNVSSYIIHIKYKFTKDTSRLAPALSTHAPVFEMYGESELRLRDGATIKAEYGTTEVEFTFSDGTTNITFSMTDLQALYNIIHPQT